MSATTRSRDIWGGAGIANDDLQAIAEAFFRSGQRYGRAEAGDAQDMERRQVFEVAHCFFRLGLERVKAEQYAAELDREAREAAGHDGLAAVDLEVIEAYLTR